MNSEFPVNLYNYYKNNASSFEERIDTKKKVFYFGVFAFCLALAFSPSILPFSVMLVRLGAIAGLIVFGFAAFLGGKRYYNRKSGGEIKDVCVKKFDSTAITERQLLSMFYDNDFVGLLNAQEANNQPVQLYIHEDEVGKVFYLQLMKYFSQSDFRGISEVIEIEEPYYSREYKTIKSIKST